MGSCKGKLVTAVPKHLKMSDYFVAVQWRLKLQLVQQPLLTPETQQAQLPLESGHRT